MTTNESCFRIGNLDGILFALSFEVGLLQLNILEGCTDLRSQCLKPISKVQRLQREKLSRDRYRNNKRRRCNLLRETVKDILRKTLIEVSENGEFQTLIMATEYLYQRESSAMYKRLDKEKLKTSLETIIEELYTKRKKWEANLQEIDNKIPALRDKISDDSFNVTARLRYAEKWLLARTESLELEYNNQRGSGPRVDNEQRIHKELLKTYELQTKEHERSLDYWQQRYSTDVTKINEKLKLCIEHLKYTINHRIELQKIYNLHEGEIRGWLTFKRERAARLAREERHRASATRIQAWWRGVMVRRALGAFKLLRNAKKSANKQLKKKYSFVSF